MAFKAPQNQPQPYSDLWVSLFVPFLAVHHAHWPPFSSWTTMCALAVGLTHLLFQMPLPQLFHSLAPPCHLGLSSNVTVPQKSSLIAWSKSILQSLFDTFFFFSDLHSTHDHPKASFAHLPVSTSSNTISLRTGTTSSFTTIFSAHWVNDWILWVTKWDLRKMAYVKSHSSWEAEITMQSILLEINSEQFNLHKPLVQ